MATGALVACRSRLIAKLSSSMKPRGKSAPRLRRTASGTFDPVAGRSIRVSGGVVIEGLPVGRSATFGVGSPLRCSDRGPAAVGQLDARQFRGIDVASPSDSYEVVKDRLGLRP
jgi:hypothetical protein